MAARGLYQCDTSGVIPDVRTEAHRTAQYSASGERQIDTGTAMHTQPRGDAAQFLQHGQAVPPRNPALPINIEGAQAHGHVRKIGARQGRHRNSVAEQRTARHGGVFLPMNGNQVSPATGTPSDISPSRIAAIGEPAA